jgi:hypothetical protein
MVGVLTMFSELTTRREPRGGGHACGGAEGVSKFVGEEQDEDAFRPPPEIQKASLEKAIHAEELRA